MSKIWISDTSMQGSIPPENGSNTNETIHDASIPPKNSETLSSTQEKSLDMCGTEDNSIDLDSTQPTSMDTSVPPENVDSMLVIDISQSDDEILS